ncbi:hypothetical protein PR048_012360 [Dryococelus australis]|uniref:Transposase n=1 Tax=Dryococelus australis TaxID=614101 RepID=A0ABQ9HPA1_9NEOP|nr:hypothetical protein PR048_012360 [Dryococelus australis]
MPQNLTLSRAKIDMYLKEHNFMEVMNDPKWIFSWDETAFFLCPKGNTVLARKGTQNIYQQVNVWAKENVSLCW